MLKIFLKGGARKGAYRSFMTVKVWHETRENSPVDYFATRPTGSPTIGTKIAILKNRSE